MCLFDVEEQNAFLKARHMNTLADELLTDPHT
jgi:hypothetical protein